MADVLTAKQRSYNMSRIRSTGTGPENMLSKLLKENGFGSFESHPSNIEGRPDFYFPSERVAVFVDGCFWHGCNKCFKLPATNRAFWKAKIRRNTLRDRRADKVLRLQGITPLRIKEHVLKKNPRSIIEKISEKVRTGYRPTVLDLFAGAGGFSEGFMRAGYDVVAHIEMERNACSTLTTRMIYHALFKKGALADYKRYLLGEISRDGLVEKYGLEEEKDSVICSKIGRDNYKKLIGEVRKRLKGKKLDMIIGGPPCQAYSYIGRARDNEKMKSDDRNFLYKYYVEFLKALKPKIFIFENVPGLETAGDGKHLRDMRRLMKRAGYTTDYKILDTVNFGVPQSRKRMILIGWGQNSKLGAYPEFPTVVREYLVRDFLADLPKVKAGGGKAVREFSKQNELLSRLSVASPWLGLLMEHVARPNTRRDLEIYRRAVLMKKNGGNMRYNHLPKRLKTHKNEGGFLDRFKVVDGNALGSHTIVAHLAKDGNFYIHPDIRQNRSLTVREAARLQTFPDDYKFEGSRGPQFKQIGNAVPPLFAETIAKNLLNFI